MFIRDLFSHRARVSVKDQSKKKENCRIDWILALKHLGAIPYLDACVETAAGYRRLYDLRPEDFLHDGKTLDDYFGYPLSDIMQRMIPSGLPDGRMAPETMDLHAMPISTEDAQFRSMYTQMCRFSTKLVVAWFRKRWTSSPRLLLNVLCIRQTSLSMISSHRYVGGKSCTLR
jgi:hypothetical protein